MDTDTDNDGIIDLVERTAPNDGDANFDGVQDSTQTQVVTLPIRS